MNQIIINGKQVQVQGKKIKVIMVDDVVVDKDLSGDVHIIFEGDLADLDCTTATINGNVQGNVDCTTATISGNVQGDVDCMSLTCQDIGGDVDCTNLKCRDIHGDVDAVNVSKQK